MKEEELEFISVSGDDHDNMMTSTYVDPSAPDRNNAIGNWVLNQSKVRSFALWLVFLLHVLIFSP